jgi:hypothetical protein
VVFEVVARSKEETRQVASCLGTVLAIAGFAFALGTSVAVWRTRSSIDWTQQGLTFAMLVWLPLVALPFIYLLAWGMNYGVLMKHEPVATRRSAGPVLDACSDRDRLQRDLARSRSSPIQPRTRSRWGLVVLRGMRHRPAVPSVTRKRDRRSG